MSQASVCVLGSANMDLVALVERAPRLGETVTGRSFEQLPGGKGANQALASARAGAAVRMLGAVGKDAFGREIRQVLEADGVDCSGLEVVDTPTGTAHIVVDGHGHNSIVVIPGANGDIRTLTEEHRSAIGAAETLLLQLELPLELVVEAAVHARRVGTRVVLTPAPVVPLPDDLLAATDLVVANEHEAAQLTGESDAEPAARALLDRGAGGVVVTLGRAGAMYVGRQRGVLRVPALRVEAVDTTAAGDTFAGALAVALTERRSLEEALRWAAVAAGLSVQRIGASTSMPQRAQIDAAARGAEERPAEWRS